MRSRSRGHNGEREWTEAELELLRNTPVKHPRTRTLTDEQVTELRRRMDSLTEAWTPHQLAREFNVKPYEIIRIAKRQKWAHRKWEPEGEWWRERELQEMEQERQRRKRARRGTT